MQGFDIAAALGKLGGKVESTLEKETSVKVGIKLEAVAGTWCEVALEPRLVGVGIIIPIDSYFSEGFKPPTRLGCNF